MVKRSVNTITDIEYCLSFAPFILWDFFLDKSCEGFFSFRGVIPCSAVHQPYSSSNAAVKFVVLGFFILLENPLFGKPSFIWETIWFGFLFTFVRIHFFPVCKLFKVGFPISPRRYENCSSYSQVSYCLWSLSPPISHSWVNPFLSKSCPSGKPCDTALWGFCPDRSKGTFSDTEYCGSSRDCCQKKVSETYSLFFWNNLSLVLMLLRKKNGNKGNMFITQKMEITGKQELKGKRGRYHFALQCHRQFGLV